jgi:hypothetical protein
MIPMKNARRTLVVLLVGTAVALAGCNDDLGPGDWDATVDTIALFAIERPELQGLPGAYDFINQRLRALEDLGSFGEWDIALDDADGGGFQLLTPGAIEGLEPSAGIARFQDRSFEDLVEAPRDTARYERDDPVPLAAGTVFVVKTRPDPRFSNCLRYIKLELVDTDPDRGTASLRFTRNPFCDDRALVPPDQR